MYVVAFKQLNFARNLTPESLGASDILLYSFVQPSPTTHTNTPAGVRCLLFPVPLSAWNLSYAFL